ncbi:MarR family transcriptional regulator [Seongchinamella sediminis]|uniref:MarR family transcriptional regulator n=1 Tax=Seongchinamella sediminis TaxID=2283635 RepID=A0A3L7E1C3_9GAMM|nr:MarR family winged helix-turn-helix transcriptional regulator [Seongchinamella sediminis]RLQ22061.1 MarR family transcriptional regulator [Seongchinamella sediminis]
MSHFPKHELGQALMVALRDFQRRLDADLADRGVQGIPARHRKVFMQLASEGASRSVDLAARIGVRPQSMMKTVHELEELGLVSRTADPTDSRAKLVTLTPGGRSLIDELSRSTEIVWDQYAALVGERELQQAMLLLLRLTAADVSEAA